MKQLLAWSRYAVAVVVVAIAAALQVWPLESEGPYLTFYPAVMLSAIYGGLNAGLLTTTLSGIVILYWHLREQQHISSPADWVGLSVFIASAILIVIISAAMQRARDRAIRAKERAEEAEHEISNALRYDQTHGEILRLFNSTFERQHILNGTLEVLANNHNFPSSAIYLYDEYSGIYRIAATHAVPSGFVREFRAGDGLLGNAANTNRLTILDKLDPALGITIETGLITFQPAAIVVCPVGYQKKRSAVMVLASLVPIGDRDRAFCERIASQLGVALHNVQQYNDLKLLAEQLRIRSDEISHKNAQLEQASRLKSEFLANMSHEMRTPLNAIIGFSELLRDGLAGKLDFCQRGYVNDIFESGTHLLSIINDVLDLSKIEAGKMELECEQTDIAQLVQNSHTIIKGRALEHQIRLNIEAPSSLGGAWIDPRKCKQIIYNLLSNAVKFTPDGGTVTLHAAIVDQSQARTRAAQQDIMHPALSDIHAERLLEIAISDTGIGISRADMERLFQPFTQVDSSLSRNFEGTGLGLSLVRSLVELHGGAVALRSSPGAGSTFTVWLPYHDASKTIGSAQASSASTFGASSSRMPSVLLIEQDDETADQLRLQLEALRCQLIRAVSADAARITLEVVTPDFMLIDRRLPDMDGGDLLSHLRRDEKYAFIPAILLSDDATSEKNTDATAVLQKPVASQDLAAAIARLDPGRRIERTHPSTVLLIDDDARTLEIMARYLEHANYRVLRANKAVEGIHLAQTHHPDLVVLDLMMPEISGFEVAQKLKEDGMTADIPLLVLSAQRLTRDDRRALQQHVRGIMEKSQFNQGNFIAEVQRALGNLPEVKSWQES